MLSSSIKSDFITPKALPQIRRYSKPISSNDNIHKDFKEKTRNKSSSLKPTVTETTANGSDSIKHKKNRTVYSVNPFSYNEPPKIPAPIPNKTPWTEYLTPKNASNINETISVNALFKMKCFQTNLIKYSRVKSKITKQNDTKPKLNKLIYAEMNQNFFDKKISVKSSKDKTLEKEAREAKLKMRFWKGVLDSSYPKILIKKINFSKGNSSKTLRILKKSENLTKGHSKILYNSGSITRTSRDKENKTNKIGYFNQSRIGFNNIESCMKVSNSNMSTKECGIPHHKRTKAPLSEKGFLQSGL